MVHQREDKKMLTQKDTQDLKRILEHADEDGAPKKKEVTFTFGALKVGVPPAIAAVLTAVLLLFGIKYVPGFAQATGTHKDLITKEQATNLVKEVEQRLSTDVKLIRKDVEHLRSEIKEVKELMKEQSIETKEVRSLLIKIYADFGKLINRDPMP